MVFFESAFAMMLPAVVDAASGHPDWQVFAAAALVTLFVGVAMILTLMFLPDGLASLLRRKGAR